jgi:3-oxoacyl-[acyl-carrier protein] reductase
MSQEGMETYLSGQRAIVTGSGRGIGRAIALELAKRGADVVISDVDEEAAKSVSSEIEQLGRRSLAVRCDVSRKGDVDSLVSEAVERLGGLEIFVNNAGITKDTLFIRMTPDQWEQVLDINLKGTFFGCQSAAKVMMKARTGSIVNVASVVGLMGNPGQANYASSKAGVITLTRTLAKELAPRNVRVNAVAPGFIETEMTDKLDDKARSAFLEHIPLKRPGTPDDVAGVISWLCSPYASYLTGQTIAIDGGLMDRAL